jgi:hypothetical protein
MVNLKYKIAADATYGFVTKNILMASYLFLRNLIQKLKYNNNMLLQFDTIPLLVWKIPRKNQDNKHANVKFHDKNGQHLVMLP